ncbi:MAG TPA: carboxypeptidase-like regulatory domain-containing protein [Puia sp.]|jgi:hypothetical protein|nr:carboxypeptidase-like regulatory domain-containing protein [Puia sp.]
MSANNKHTAPYTASDIEKYRKGELTAREMHDLERAALDDPFLADAIEGMTSHPTADHQQDLYDLHERLNKRVAESKRRRKIIFIQRRIVVAAALILLLGIGYTFLNHYLVIPHRAPETVAAAPRSTPAPAGVKAAPAAPELKIAAPAAADSIQFTLAQTRVEKKRSAPVSYFSQPTPAAHSDDSATLSSPLEGRTAGLALNKNFDTTKLVQFKSIPGIQYKADTLGLTLNRSKQRQPAMTNDFFNPTPATPAYSLVFSGKVLDPQNHPLAGAFLALNGNYGYGTTTDESGYFRISLHPRDSTRQLTVSLIGYDHTSLAINALSTEDATNNIIHLKPSNANLDEVVVAGYGIHRKEREAAAPSDSDEKLDTLWTHAAPVIGRQAYLQYLSVARKNLGLDSMVSGTETVSFIVARNGSLSDFKIEQSLSPAHDAGILRLVTDGPAWHLTRGKKIRASVTVNFP